MMDKMQSIPDDYVLVSPDSQNTGPVSRPANWQSVAVYCSPVCLAAHVKLLNEPPQDTEEQTRFFEPLYRYLRQIDQAALQHDHMRPVVCVVECPSNEARQIVRMRGGDQDWHRGSFILYDDTESRGDGQVSADALDKLARILQPRFEAYAHKQVEPRNYTKN